MKNNKVLLVMACLGTFLLSACSSSGGFKEVLTGSQKGVSQSIGQECRAFARDYVQKNHQKIGRDWIKHEEYRQYEICVRDKKRAKEINKKR